MADWFGSEFVGSARRRAGGAHYQLSRHPLVCVALYASDEVDEQAQRLGTYLLQRLLD